jgi:hypothetical protein
VNRKPVFCDKGYCNLVSLFKTNEKIQLLSEFLDPVLRVTKGFIQPLNGCYYLGVTLIQIPFFREKEKYQYILEL